MFMGIMMRMMMITMEDYDNDLFVRDDNNAFVFYAHYVDDYNGLRIINIFFVYDDDAIANDDEGCNNEVYDDVNVCDV